MWKFTTTSLLLLAGCLGVAQAADVAMVDLPAACVKLGPAAKLGAHEPREVCVKAFRLDRHEVTVAAYRACVAAGACRPVAKDNPRCNANVAGRDQHPASCVAYDDAARFCAWRGARLPSEDEWERAARGVDAKAYPWGDQAPSPERAAYFRSISQTTAPVCSHAAGHSAEGVCDLAGNVSEWVAGFWDRDREGAPLPEPRRLPAEGARVTHGGSIAGPVSRLAAHAREYVNFGEPVGHGQGFRCAADRKAP